MINVTKTFLPPLNEYLEYLEKVWESGWIANNGPLLRQLESELKDYLGVKHLHFLSSGTVALQIAIESLGLKGKIITTPFSYVSTTSSIVWQKCAPVFADILEDTLCINPQSVEKLIDKNCSAILATHVFGNACEVEELADIAKRHRIKLIYDAAHTFGSMYNGRHLVQYGDASVLSFHATKLFHTVEGGAVITDNDEWAHRVEYMRNLGHKGQDAFWGLGINGKNTELHAAMGLCNIRHINEISERLKERYEFYEKLFSKELIRRPVLRENLQYNYSYFPIILSSEKQLLKACKALNDRDIYPRRYFYPTLNTLPYVERVKLPVADSIAKNVLCLPLSVYIEPSEQEIVAEIVLQCVRKT